MLTPNRPDALGIFEDSKIAEVVGAFQQSRYADAVNRLVERLLFRQETVRGKANRGKRRNSNIPTKRSNTLRAYLKALERWSYYSIGKWGKEIDPREVDTDTATAYARWLRGEDAGPDIRGMLVRSMGGDFSALYEAVARAGAMYGQANIMQIVEAMEPVVRERLVRSSSDPRQPPNVIFVHKMMGKMIRSFRNIHRMPSSAQIRAEEGGIWSQRERDPMTYTYTILPQSGLSTGAVRTHLASLSALWSEMTVQISQEQAPLSFNPWRSVYARWALRWTAEQRNARLRGEMPMLTTAIVNSMFNACRGAHLEERRNTLAMTLLVGYGLRAEELAGLLRKDLVNVDGILNIAVLGKGNKVRQVPLYSEVRDSLTLLTGKLEEEAQKTFVDDDGQVVELYNAAYATGLLQDEAPLVPSLARWGCNQKDRDPAADALETLDVSGIRAILARIAERARVREIATGAVRPLSTCTADCKTKPCRHELKRVHPHAFRHYAATAAQQSGVSMVDVMGVLGHEDVRTTKGYIQVSPQKSMAFSAGVFRAIHRQPAMTPDDIEGMKTKGMNPLEDPDIVEAEPEDARRSKMASSARRAATDGRRIAAPMWGYQGGEALEQFYPPFNGRPNGFFKSFASDNTKRKGVLLQAIEEARRVGDVQAEKNAAAMYMQAAARKVWNTFRVGVDTRLPWWAGHSNRWPEGRMAPILSYPQIAAEDREQSEIIQELMKLHDKLWADQGPTAANALVTWLGEIISVSNEFAKDMVERGNTWVLFEEEADAGDDNVVREHAPGPVLEWFERYGWALRATIAKGAKNRGNIALAAMDELPEWFWYPDPLLALDGDERQALKDWVTKLQSTRKSRIRFDQWVDQFSARVARWGNERRAYERATGEPWEPSDTSATAQRLAGKIQFMLSDFASMFPTVTKKPDVGKIAQAPEAEVRQTIRSMLAEQGIDPANPSRANLPPAIKGRAGQLHPFDPALLTFDLRSTIVHDEPTKKYWYEKFGTDSECVVRRAVRALWEMRKTALQPMAPSLVTKHFDAELSALIPCPQEMERRMVQRGWDQPKSIDDLVNASKVMWEGLTDLMRISQGIAPTTTIPLKPIEDFWEPELEEFTGTIYRFSSGMPIVVEGAAAQVVLDRIEQDATPPLPGGQLDTPEKRHTFSDCDPPGIPVDLDLYRQLTDAEMIESGHPNPLWRLVDWAIQAHDEANPPGSPDTKPWSKLSSLELITYLPALPLVLDRPILARLEQIVDQMRPSGDDVDNSVGEVWTKRVAQEGREWQAEVMQWLESADVPSELKTDSVVRALVHGSPEIFDAASAIVCGHLQEGNQMASDYLDRPPRRDSEQGKESQKQAKLIALELHRMSHDLKDLESEYVKNKASTQPGGFPAIKAGKKVKPGSAAQRRRSDSAQAALELETLATNDACQNLGRTTITLDGPAFVRVLQTPAELIVFGSANAASAYRSAHLRHVMATLGKFDPEAKWNWQTLRLELGWKGQGASLAGMSPIALRNKLSASVLEVQLPCLFERNPSEPAWHDDRDWQPRWPGYPAVDEADLDSAVMRTLPWPQAGTTGIVPACVESGCMQLYSRWKRNGLTPDTLPRGWTQAPSPGPADRKPRPSAHPVELVFAALRST